MMNPSLGLADLAHQTLGTYGKGKCKELTFQSNRVISVSIAHETGHWYVDTSK